LFGQVVAAHRRRLGLTQEELARHSGLGVRSIRDLERGLVRVPRASTVRLLAVAFELDGAELRQFETAGAGPPGSASEAGRRVPVPAQLPATGTWFCGRDRDLGWLDQAAARNGAERGRPAGPPAEPDRPPEPAGAAGAVAVPVVVISGTAGVGKTALALHWAHRVRDRFPDGQLYVNLRGFDPSGQVLTPAAAVRGFLDALGVSKEGIPAHADAQIALYRSLLAGRRMLVVIDNARDADHARPLLPGSPAALAVVTSRDSLAGLVAVDGAHPRILDLLTHDEARDLLDRRIRAGRVQAEPDAAEQIIAACARLPLALSLVAARAATHPGFSLAELSAELSATGDPAGRLDAGDLLGRVRTVFSWSYRALTPPAARLFRLLGLHPGPDTTAPATASLAGRPPADTWPLLAELTCSGLLTEHAPGRYTFHDLLAAYATDLTRSLDTEEERRAATVRLLDHYTHTTHTANGLMHPTREPIPLPLTRPAAGATPERPASQQKALAWLQAERPVLLAAQRLAAAGGLDTHAWQLAWALDTVLYRRGHWHDLARAWQAALPAADPRTHPAATAYAHRRLAQALTVLGDHDPADTHLQHALHLYTEADDRIGQADTHHALSYLRARRDQPDQALHHSQQALTRYQTAGHRRGQAHALNAVGWNHLLLGNPTEALNRCQQALALFQQLGDRWGEAATWDSLGYAQHRLCHFPDAVDSYQHALTLHRDLGDRYYQATVLTHLGDTHHAAGHPEHAGTAWAEALDILTDLDYPTADAIRTKLATPDTAPPA
jgi:tetratricopeptide (TPR) repeat protein/transcriptional regulator with XRE-family HTH domain